MNSIEIQINKIGRIDKILVDLTLKTVLINDTLKYVTEDKINELFRIIRKYKGYTSNSSIIDGDEVIINVNINNESEKIYIKGENYNALIDWMYDLYE